MKLDAIANVLKRLVVEDGGQDLVEYALLAAFVALAGLVATDAIQSSFQTSYESWNTGTQGLWESPSPSGH